jgi:hypothetical protein
VPCHVRLETASEDGALSCTLEFRSHALVLARIQIARCAVQMVCVSTWACKKSALVNQSAGPRESESRLGCAARSGYIVSVMTVLIFREQLFAIVPFRALGVGPEVSNNMSECHDPSFNPCEFR